MFSTTGHLRASTLPCSVCPRGTIRMTKMAFWLLRHQQDAYQQGCWKETRGPPNMQRVVDVAGQTIGRVPANLSAFIKTNLNLHNLLKVKAFFTGHIIHGGVMRGGGPKLECAYVLTYPRNAPYQDMFHDLFHHCRIPSSNLFCWSVWYNKCFPELCSFPIESGDYRNLLWWNNINY